MKLKQRVVRAEKRLSKGWCQSYLAADKNEQEVDPTSRRAVAWCFLGAFSDEGANIAEDWIDEVEDLFAKVAPAAWKNCQGSIPDWNDHPRRTHKQVMAVVAKIKEVVA